MAKESKEFVERKGLMKIQSEHDLVKHNLKMKELEYSRESNRLFHEKELERGRIKNAEFRKNLLLKDKNRRY